METELGFGPGNELSWMNTYFSIGTIIGGTFSNLVITVVRPSYWLPGCLGVWSVFVLGLFRCQTATQFYVLRFFVGVFESAAWPGVSKSLIFFLFELAFASLSLEKQCMEQGLFSMF